MRMTRPHPQGVPPMRLTEPAKVERVRRDMKSPEAVLLLAETFRALGDPNRLRIVHALSQEELCVLDIAAAIGMSQSAVSHSLRTLRQLRLVSSRKESKTTYYPLDDDHITRLISNAFAHVEERL
jgi:DNA-binding transcriptional ArsR family regulator